MEILAAWFIGAVIVAMIASSRGRDALRWLIVSTLLSPVIAILLVFALDRVDLNAPTSDTHVKCPDCAELVRREAKVCKHCGARLVPQ